MTSSTLNFYQSISTVYHNYEAIVYMNTIIKILKIRNMILILTWTNFQNFNFFIRCKLRIKGRSLLYDEKGLAFVYKLVDLHKQLKNNTNVLYLLCFDHFPSDFLIEFYL